MSQIKINYPKVDAEFDGIRGWYNETLNKFIPKKYLAAFNKEFGCQTAAIDPSNGKIVYYEWDVRNALEKVINGVDYLWD